MRTIWPALVFLWPLHRVATAAAQAPDHLKWYKIKDPLKLAAIADLDTLLFADDPGCTISKTELVCIPATKTNHGDR